MSQESIRIKYFNPKTIPKDSTIVLIGPRRTGKSTLIKDIMYHMRDIPLGLVISRTDRLSHFFDQFVPGMFIHDSYKPEIVSKLFTRQEKALKDQWRCPEAFLIMDDCLSEKKVWNKDKNIDEIFLNGRHYKILFLLAMQSPQGISSSFKSNIDFIFILKPRNENEIDLLFKNYTSAFPSKKIFKQVLEQCTEDNHCLVIDNSNKSNKISDTVFIYKANPNLNYKLCHPSTWRADNVQFKEQEKSNTKSKIKKNITVDIR